MNSIAKRILIPFILFISLFNTKILVTKAFNPTTPTLNVNLTSEELINKFNTFFSTSPNLTYGQATYNYIKNTFIPQKKWEEYGKYYVCLIKGSAYTSHCYISDNVDIVGLHFPANTFEQNVNEVNFGLNRNNNIQVYDFIISSGSKGSNSGYKSLKDISDNIYSNQGSSYIRTNIKYFNLIAEYESYYVKYNSIKTNDNYYFNLNDIVVYLENGSYKFNHDYKVSEDFADLKLDIILDDYKLLGDYYISKTYKLTFNKFDTSKYKYYYTFDPENIDNQITRLLAYDIDKNNFLLTFETNTTFYVVVRDLNNNTVLLNSYEVNDIMRSRYDESLDVFDKHPDLPDIVNEDSEITDDFTLSDLVGWFRGLIDKRLPILKQIPEIYNAFKFNLSADSSCLEVGFDYGDGHETSKGFVWRNYCNKIPEINLNGFLGMTDRFQVIDLRFFWQYRDTLFFWTKLILGTTTFFKLLRIIPGYFKH